MQTREEEAQRHTDTAIQEIESVVAEFPETQPFSEFPTPPVSASQPAALSNFYITIKHIVSLKPVQIIAGLVLIMSVMGWIEFAGPAILDNDGYYHIRWAQMLRESFPHPPPFKALPLTTLNEQKYVDHHYLFHIFLFPFTLGDLRLGAKLAAVVFSSLGILSLFALLVSYNIRYRWLWLAPLVASSEPFLYRMSMTRAPALSLALIGLGTYFILKRKHVLLALLSFAFVWFYSLFPLILLFAAAYSVTVYLAERRIDLRGVVASFSGIAVGLVVNPYFPKNLSLLYEHMLMKLTTGSGYSVDVGVEWYPYETWVMLTYSAVAFVIYFVGLAAFDYRNRERDLKPLFFLIISAMLLLMAFKSRRFIEYWPPFAVLFAAFTISPKLEMIDRSWFQRMRERVIASIAAALIAIAALVTMTTTIWQAYEDVKSEQDPYAYEGASEWIAANTPPDSIIFNTDWDDFPMLFYFNPGNTYIVGLDPSYLYNSDQELWNLYARITLGDEDDPAPLIRERFGAEYVFTDNGHTDFLSVAAESGDFETVYKDRYTTVLRIRSPGGAKQKSESDSEQP
ncbi:MAG TPA: hypothetical protein VLR90_06335 [Blastocatellia bacterium]|nr:hypothetical protein [Blastocatellia bacterium]